MNLRLPAWVGWPGGGTPPSYHWVPGPILRFIILLLAYGFVALALTVNYAASIAFFLLSIIGMYIGLRRGFLNGLSRTEKLLLLAFATYPAVAIISYLFGTQTDIGFRFLGRDLRFLLFIPVYIAIRLARPRLGHAGWAFTGSALGAFIIAILQNRPWPAPTPHGVAGTHITFGDLALLSGFLGASLLLIEGHLGAGRQMRNAPRLVGAVFAVVGAVGASAVSGARGSWLALPLLIAMIVMALPRQSLPRWHPKILITIVGFFLVASVGALIPNVRHRMVEAYQTTKAYTAVANYKAVNSYCVDERGFLSALLQRSKVKGSGAARVVPLSKQNQHDIRERGCMGAYALLLVNPRDAHEPFTVWLYRGNKKYAGQRTQQAIALFKGVGAFSMGWKGPWKRVRYVDRWEKKLSDQAYSSLKPMIVRVPAGSQLRVVPIQRPRGIFAYALADSSIGRRLQMWRASVSLFYRSPWLGSGTGSFASLGQDALSGSVTAPVVGAYEHAHSDYMTSLGTEGSLGLMAFIFLLLCPFIVVWLTSSASPKDRRILIPMGILVSGFAIFAITETMFIHSLVNSWYVVVGSILLGVTTTAALDPLPKNSRHTTMRFASYDVS